MANLIYIAEQSPVIFQDSGGTVVLGMQNLAFGVGRISARVDRGAGSKPGRHKWKGKFQFETAAALGEGVYLYLAESDGTYADGVVGTANAALIAAQLPNLKQIGLVTVQTVATATDHIASGAFMIYERYYSIGVWNGSAGDNLENTANANSIIVTAFVDEIQ